VITGFLCTRQGALELYLGASASKASFLYPQEIGAFAVSGVWVMLMRIIGLCLWYKGEKGDRDGKNEDREHYLSMIAVFR
jgi:hypothetical protein